MYHVQCVFHFACLHDACEDVLAAVNVIKEIWEDIPPELEIRNKTVKQYITTDKARNIYNYARGVGFHKQKDIKIVLEPASEIDRYSASFYWQYQAFILV